MQPRAYSSSFTPGCGFGPPADGWAHRGTAESQPKYLECGAAAGLNESNMPNNQNQKRLTLSVPQKPLGTIAFSTSGLFF